MGYLLKMQIAGPHPQSPKRRISGEEAQNSAYLTFLPGDPHAKLENLCNLGMWLEDDLGGDGASLPPATGRWPHLGSSPFSAHRLLPTNLFVSCSQLSSQMFSSKRSFFRIHASWRPRYPLTCSSCPHSSLPHPVQGLERGTGWA